MDLIAFAYDFPHKKTYEGLLRLFVERVPVSAVIAAPRVQLNIRESRIRVAPAGLTFPHPREVAARIGVPYFVAAHNSPECMRILRKFSPRVGVVLGARILSQEVIDCFSTGILNMHPGLIPENRGLDNVKWAILNGHEQGVTTHLIAGGKDVDLGRLIERRIVPTLKDDTLVDLCVRIQNVELDAMIAAIRRIEAGETFQPFTDRGVYRSAISPDDEAVLMERFSQWKASR